MKIEKEFEVAQPPGVVWQAFADLPLVASCVPGASIVEDLGDGRHRARFAVKVGPLAAAFDGEMALRRDEAHRVGVVEGKGADARSNSRVSGSMTYRLVDAGSATRIQLDCTMNLAGALAQFGKAAIMREVISRITAEFARNLEAQLATGGVATTPESVSATPPEPGSPVEPEGTATAGAPPSPRFGPASQPGHRNVDETAVSREPASRIPTAGPTASLDVGKLFAAIVRDWLRRVWRSLAGTRHGER